ncbi:hypothetical protein MTR67_021566 [Solanum verrucosum]|uniref:Uncharacterized protein n=1 Tax=Solanum verrucosum TaxID=315347 RepID=A0AAF0QX51_SOLVR|nr:hypothetical protein MTR67_021566 [Solanum verrucosum]
MMNSDCLRLARQRLSQSEFVLSPWDSVTSFGDWRTRYRVMTRLIWELLNRIIIVAIWVNMLG